MKLTFPTSPKHNSTKKLEPQQQQPRAIVTRASGSTEGKWVHISEANTPPLNQCEVYKIFIPQTLTAC